MSEWKCLIQDRITPLRLEPAGEAHLVEEIAAHLEDIYRDALAGGAEPEEARRLALAELDDMYPLREEAKLQRQAPRRDPVPAGDNRRAHFLDSLWKDIRYAARAMRQSPLFATFVVLTLALGIGANTAVFTLIDSLILNPMPVANAASLAAVETIATQPASPTNAPFPVSYANLIDYRDRNAVFDSLAGYTGPRVVTWQASGASQRLFAEIVTGNYFSTLGLKPARGRFFLPEEDRVPGAYPVAVMNYGTWQNLFGGADIIGKTVRVNSVVLTVVGIAPPRFIGVNAVFGPDLWLPAAMAAQVMPNEMSAIRTDRTKTVFTGIGRLKPGVSRARAQANLAAIAADLAREDPAANEGHTAVVVSLREVFFGSNGTGLQPILFGSITLLLVVGIVLLIACSNVANLLLARSAARRQEMAVRLALGASRPRLVQQLLTESVLLGLMGGAAGIFIGYAGLHLLLSALPGSANFFTPRLDLTVLGFAFLISAGAGFLFGIVPAFQASRTGVSESLKEESRTLGRSRRRVTFAGALLAAQVAFSFLLLVTAALFLRSIGRAYDYDPGFQTAHLAVFMTTPGQAGYAKTRTKAFYDEALQRVERLPGVASAAWSSNLPLWNRVVTGLEIEGRQTRSRADKLNTVVTTIGPKYFDTSGVKLDSGRNFSVLDQAGSAPVAIVNEKLARDYWPNGDALGKRIRLPGEPEMRQIVGIARTANYSSWAEPPQPCVYLPMEQNFNDAMSLFVRSHGDPAQLIAPVENELHAAGPEVVASSPRTGRQIVDGGLFQQKMGVTLLAVFGLLALGLASIGLYGILAYSVNQRKREIGLRMALGASNGEVLGLILRQGMSLVLVGVAFGLVAALFAGRMLSRMLYGISPADPLSLAIAAATMAAVALLACYLPARRASRVDPLTALREG